MQLGDNCVGLFLDAKSLYPIPHSRMAERAQRDHVLVLRISSVALIFAALEAKSMRLISITMLTKSRCGDLKSVTGIIYHGSNASATMMSILMRC